MFKEKANESNNELIGHVQEVHQKLKILENIRAASFVDWKFTEEENCSVSEVKKVKFLIQLNFN